MVSAPFLASGQPLQPAPSWGAGAQPPPLSPSLIFLCFSLCFSPAKWGYTCWEPPAAARGISRDQDPPRSVPKAIPMADSWGWG